MAKRGSARASALCVDSDEFRMYYCKIHPCRKRYSHDWSECVFAHVGEKVQRRCPIKYNYLGFMCPGIKQSGECSHSRSCRFAHNSFEYWLHPTRYKTEACNFGSSCKRAMCFFAHSASELRTFDGTFGSPTKGSGVVPDLGDAVVPSSKPPSLPQVDADLDQSFSTVPAAAGAPYTALLSPKPRAQSPTHALPTLRAPHCTPQAFSQDKQRRPLLLQPASSPPDPAHLLHSSLLLQALPHHSPATPSTTPYAQKPSQAEAQPSPPRLPSNSRYAQLTLPTHRCAAPHVRHCMATPPAYEFPAQETYNLQTTPASSRAQPSTQQQHPPQGTAAPRAIQLPDSYHPFAALASNPYLTTTAQFNAMDTQVMRDQLSGGGHHDQLSGGGHHDQLSGGGHHDQLSGGGHHDQLSGGGHHDQLSGGGHHDQLSGGGHHAANSHCAAPLHAADPCRHDPTAYQALQPHFQGQQQLAVTDAYAWHARGSHCPVKEAMQCPSQWASMGYPDLPLDLSDQQPPAMAPYLSDPTTFHPAAGQAGAPHVTDLRLPQLGALRPGSAMNPRATLLPGAGHHMSGATGSRVHMGPQHALQAGAASGAVMEHW